MKAVVLRGPGELEFAEMPEPTPGPGEVIVQVSHCGICGSDLHFWRTGPFGDSMILGHELSGTIVEVGAEVADWSPGQRVGTATGKPCGACVYCRTGDPQLCDEAKGIGTGRWPGGYAQYVALPAKSLIAVPDPVTFQQAAALEPLGNGVHCVRKSAFRPGDSAAVIGAGPIGLAVIAWLRRSGAGKILASEPSESRRTVARAMGADVVVDPTRDSMAEACASECEGVGPHVVFECVGRPDTIMEACFQVRKGGEVVIVGLCMEPIALNPVMMITRELRLRASYGATKSEMEEVLAALAEGGLSTEGYLTDEIALADVPAAFERLNRPTVDVKVLIDHAR